MTAIRKILFPVYFYKIHPKHREPTFWIEKLWESIGLPNKKYCFNWPDEYVSFLRCDEEIVWPKHHIIKTGKSWKQGDIFQPKGFVFMGTYFDLAPPLEIKTVYDLEIDCSQRFKINGKDFKNLPLLAKNEGLELKDFLDWYPRYRVFSGQILIWSDRVKY